MTSACSILCPTIDFVKVWHAVRSASDAEVSLEGTSENWSRITFQQAGEQLTLSSLVQEQPGDKFSRFVLSMHNHFRTVETDVESNKKVILDRIANVKMMIGVVAEPEFLPDDDRFNIL